MHVLHGFELASQRCDQPFRHQGEAIFGPVPLPMPASSNPLHGLAPEQQAGIPTCRRRCWRGWLRSDQLIAPNWGVWRYSPRRLNLSDFS